jgi:hypothetical protein
VSGREHRFILALPSLVLPKPQRHELTAVGIAALAAKIDLLRGTRTKPLLSEVVDCAVHLGQELRPLKESFSWSTLHVSGTSPAGGASVSCDLTNTPPVTRGPTNTVTADCGSYGSGTSTNAVVNVTGTW